jgi:LDH2 family malate/lactate/ureidoglycolate dehydrogenase
MMQEDALYSFAQSLFCKVGMPEKDADYAAKCIIQSNLWGLDSHGLIRLPVYIERLAHGAIKAVPDIRVIREFGAVARLDGGEGIGYVVARETLRKAISLARAHGIGSVTVCRSNHFGAAGLFAREAAREGMIGIIMSNTVPNMGAPGSSGVVLGNHPMAWAVPMPGLSPFVMDFCLSQVAQGKLLVAKEKGEKIPFGWAVDKDGKATDDPAAGLTGCLLPMGGHKGYGLALMVEMMTGILSGGAFLGDLKSMYRQAREPSGISHHMLVMNPLAVMESQEWRDRVHELRRRIKAIPTKEEGASLVFPGEPEEACEIQRKTEGIPVPESLFDTLSALGRRFSVELARP